MRISTEAARNCPSSKPNETNVCAGPRQSSSNGSTAYHAVRSRRRSYARSSHATV
ncbi:MAG TPA: hypothetical protein VF710_10260 [Longimicrobium sp.]